jgi:hypothetical protein
VNTHYKDVYLRLSINERKARHAYEEYLASAVAPVTWHTWWRDWVDGIVTDLGRPGGDTYELEVERYA